MERKGSKNWEKLNTYQQEAVLDESPACVVNANVGSGKTTVLIAKILYLHWEKKVPLEDMLVLTFTNKAAREITDRLRAREPELFPEQIRGFGTFSQCGYAAFERETIYRKSRNGPGISL